MNWYPNLEGILPGQAAQAIRRVLDAVYGLREQVNKIPVADLLTRQQAESRYSAAVVREKIQSSGPAPLNVTGLVGQLAQPQYAYVPDVEDLPNVLLDPLSQDRLLIVKNRQLYVFDAAVEPGRWEIVGLTVFQDTHAQRLTNPDYDPEELAEGTMFWETDRTVLYMVRTVNGTKVWQYRLGRMRGSFSPDERPTDLGANDTGFLFHASDLGRTFRWSGTAWDNEMELGVILEESHANRIAAGTLNLNGTNVTWASGSKFGLDWEGKLIACLYHWSGTVGTNGTKVYWDSGDPFQAVMAGQKITIGGAEYRIASVDGPYELTLTSDAGGLSGVPYTAHFWRTAQVASVLSDQSLQLTADAGSISGTDYILYSARASAYRNGVQLYESDRTVTYVVRPATGRVNVSGQTVTYDGGLMFDHAWFGQTMVLTLDVSGTVSTAGTEVTWVSGDQFDGAWAGQAITINGTAYKIDRVVDATHLYLQTPAGSQSGVAYSGSFEMRYPIDYVTSSTSLHLGVNAGTRVGIDYRVENGAWWYESGQLTCLLADLPTDLGLQDVGFLAFAADYQHAYQWRNYWDFAPGDPGSGYIVATAGSAPTGGLWALCDGSTVGIATGAGGTQVVTTPDLTGNVFLKGGSYSGVNPASRATWEDSAKTATEAAHTHGVGTYGVSVGDDSAAVNTYLGTDTNCAASPHGHSASMSGASGAGSAHYHTLGADAQLKVPNETNGGLPKNIALTWYIRR